MKRTISVAMMPALYAPDPSAIPIAATAQSVAAVVSPRMVSPWRMIAPAPRKPMPLTIWAEMRDGSRRATTVDD